MMENLERNQGCHQVTETNEEQKHISYLHILILLTKGITKRSFQDPKESNQLTPMHTTHCSKVTYQVG